jgi:hypothetical protein
MAQKVLKIAQKCNVEKNLPKRFKNLNNKPNRAKNVDYIPNDKKYALS